MRVGRATGAESTWGGGGAAGVQETNIDEQRKNGARTFVTANILTEFYILNISNCHEGRFCVTLFFSELTTAGVNNWRV